MLAIFIVILGIAYITSEPAPKKNSKHKKEL